MRGGTAALADVAGGEEPPIKPIKPKLYFRPQSARAKRKEKAARTRTGMASSVSLPELSPPKLGAADHESRVRVGGRGGGTRAPPSRTNPTPKLSPNPNPNPNPNPDPNYLTRPRAGGRASMRRPRLASERAER